MGFVFLLIGMAGIAGSIEVGTNPKYAVVVFAIGVILFVRDYRKFLKEERRR